PHAELYTEAPVPQPPSYHADSYAALPSLAGENLLRFAASSSQSQYTEYVSSSTRNNGKKVATPPRSSVASNARQSPERFTNLSARRSAAIPLRSPSWTRPSRTLPYFHAAPRSLPGRGPLCSLASIAISIRSWSRSTRSSTTSPPTCL